MSNFSSRLCLIFSLYLIFSTAVWAESLTTLSRNLKLDPKQTTVSGLSSGAFMAVQLQVINSKTISGAGVIAGGPYRCAAGQYIRPWLDLTGMYAMLSVCTHTYPAIWGRHPSPDLAFSIHETERLAAAGLIDDPSNMAKQRVWMFSGAKDLLVPSQVMDSLQNYYQHFMPATQISYVKSEQASHGMITDNYGGACKLTLPPFINDCDFDAAGALLQQIYSKLQAKTAAQLNHLYTVDQQVFFDKTDPSVSMHQNAHIYIPSTCAQGQTCKLHIALHGCGQTEDLIGDMFYTKAGYNNWAESNRIVVLYPQAKVWLGSSFSLNAQRNFQACWDWWGYSGEHYADKQGKQIRALSQMIEVLTKQ